MQSDKGRLYDSWVKNDVIVHLGLSVTRSAQNCRCMVDASNTGSNLNIIIVNEKQ